jgi:hypothetical protein
MAESEDNLSNIESEDEEIARILDGRHAKNTIKATKNALKTFLDAVGDVEGLADKKMLKCSFNLATRPETALFGQFGL